METIGKRLSLLINSQGINPAQFASEMGEDKSKIGKYLKDLNKPGADFLAKVLNRYLELNARWLLVGEGGMWNNSNQDDQFHEESRKYTTSKEDDLRRTIEVQDKLIKMLEIENEMLRKQSTGIITV